MAWALEQDGTRRPLGRGALERAALGADGWRDITGAQEGVAVLDRSQDDVVDLTQEVGVPAVQPELPAMKMLGDGVPLSLLMDLAAAGGPDSGEILRQEGRPEQPWWEQPGHGV